MSDTNDEELLAGLRKALIDSDTVPQTATDLAKAIPSIERIDAELAELASLDAAVRNTSSSQQKVFTVRGLSIVVDHGPPLTVETIGLLVDDVANVSLERSDGSTFSTELHQGRHQASIDPGVWRVIISTPARRIGTDWFTTN